MTIYEQLQCQSRRLQHPGILRQVSRLRNASKDRLIVALSIVTSLLTGMQADLNKVTI